MFWYTLAIIPALYWLGALLRALQGRGTIPELRSLPAAEDAAGLPKLSVVVPARNEEGGIRACLESLVAQEYPNLEIIVIDDRSSDGTGRIADELAAAHPERITVEHLTECPPGWLGKCNALSVGASKATGEYILFADADVMFEPTALSRAVNFAVREDADMLVAFPDIITQTAGEKMMILTFAQCFTVVYPPHRAQQSDSNAYVGVGAFNMVRAAFYRKVHGHRFLRLQVIDDVGLGKIIKHSGGKLRVVFGAGMLRVRWQMSLVDTIKGLEKNAFASFGYSLPKAVIAVGGMLLVYWWPWIGMFVGPLWARVVCAATALLLQPLLGLAAKKFGGMNPLYAFSGPIGAIFMAAAIVRSTVVTLRQGGIRWRDSFYPLKELRQFKL